LPPGSPRLRLPGMDKAGLYRCEGTATDGKPSYGSSPLGVGGSALAQFRSTCDLEGIDLQAVTIYRCDLKGNPRGKPVTTLGDAIGMDADDLTPEQCAQLLARLRPMHGYLTRLHDRIERRHFPPDDRLRQEVKAACDAMLRLTVDLHYRSCQGKTGRR
jgi:hypothetical protein